MSFRAWQLTLNLGIPSYAARSTLFKLVVGCDVYQRRPVFEMIGMESLETMLSVPLKQWVLDSLSH